MFNPWVGKIPWRRAWQPTPVFLPGETPWTSSPVHGMAESDITEQLRTTLYLYIYIYIYIFFLILFSFMVYYRMLNRVPCAIK